MKVKEFLKWLAEAGLQETITSSVNSRVGRISKTSSYPVLKKGFLSVFGLMTFMLLAFISTAVNVYGEADGAEVSQPLELSDFIVQDKCLEFPLDVLREKGFSMIEDRFSDGVPDNYVFTKGEMMVIYAEYVDRKGIKSKGVEINFPSEKEAKDFLSPLEKNGNWRLFDAPLGKCFKNDCLLIYPENRIVQIQYCEDFRNL